MLQGWMVTRIPALIFGGVVETGCLYFLYFVSIPAPFPKNTRILPIEESIERIINGYQCEDSV
jgi:hypothetical protein